MPHPGHTRRLADNVFFSRSRFLNRARTALALALVAGLALVLPGSAFAQFHAPKTVEEIENEPQHHKGKNTKSSDDDDTSESEGLPTDTGPEPDDNPPQEAGDDIQRSPLPPAPEQPTPTGKPGRHVRDAGGSMAQKGPPDSGAPDAGPSAADGGLAEALPLIPPKSSWSSLQDTWDTRRKAVVGHNPKVETQAEEQLLKAREELGIRDLTSMAGALDHEANLSLDAKDPAEATRLANLAVTLAPDSPAARFALARVKIASDVSNVGDAIGALRDGVTRAMTQTGTRLSFIGNLGAAAGLGLALAAVLGILGLAIRPLRYALHDFHHLFPRGALPAQTTVLFVLLLLLPWAFKLGPLAELATLAAAAFLYVRNAERVVMTALLALLAALPTLGGMGGRALVYVGTLSEAEERVQEGGPDAAESVAHLETLEKNGQADAAVLFVLGLDAKRAGRYPQAIERYKKALAMSPRLAEAQNNLGNALLITGDLEGARDAYLSAAQLAPDSATVHYNLAKASVRKAQLQTKERDVSDDIERGKAATSAVYRLDRSLMDRPSDNRANLFVIDMELPATSVAAAREAPAVEASVTRQLRDQIWGSAVPGASEVFTLAMVLGFWGLSFAGARLKPCAECGRCGRPVCARCDREVAGGTNCGQCHNAFVKKGAVDPPTRARKEASARKYQDRWQKGRRLASYLMAGMGHLLGGRPVVGTVFLLIALMAGAALVLGEGLFRVPFGGGLELPREILGGLLLVAAWALSIRSYRSGEDRRVI